MYTSSSHNNNSSKTVAIAVTLTQTPPITITTPIADKEPPPGPAAPRASAAGRHPAVPAERAAGRLSSAGRYKRRNATRACEMYTSSSHNNNNNNSSNNNHTNTDTTNNNNNANSRQRAPGGRCPCGADVAHERASASPVCNAGTSTCTSESAVWDASSRKERAAVPIRGCSWAASSRAGRTRTSSSLCAQTVHQQFVIRRLDCR